MLNLRRLRLSSSVRRTDCTGDDCSNRRLRRESCSGSEQGRRKSKSLLVNRLGSVKLSKVESDIGVEVDGLAIAL